MKEAIKILKNIFIARYDFYWLYKPNKSPFIVYKNNVKKKENLIKLTDDDIQDHIDGNKILGISPFINDDKIKWGCIDIDAHFKDESLVEQNKIYEQNQEDCFKLYEELKKQGYTSIIDTCDQRGWHIYLLQKNTEAIKVRKFLKLLMKKTLNNENKHEIFPKQNKLSDSEKGFGNQVKLHLSLHPVKRKFVTVFDVENKKQLNSEESINYLSKINIDNLKEVEFDEEEYKKLELDDFTKVEHKIDFNRFIPQYCAFIEEGCSKLSLPHSDVTRHLYIDPNVSAYTWDWRNDEKKEKIRKRYLKIQNKKESALQNWNVHNFNCTRFKEFCEEHGDNENAKICISKCKSCSDIFNKQYYNSLVEEKKEEDKIGEKLDITLLRNKNFFNLAEEFIKKQPLFFDEANIWWVWDGKKYKWSIKDDIAILNILDEFFNYNILTLTPKIKNQLLDVLKRTGRRNIPNNFNKNFIQFNNTVINILTGEKFLAKSKFMVTNPIPWDIGESDETPIMDSVFESWVGEENVKTLYQIIAYCCLPDYPLHRIITLVGAGSNGKSKYLAIIDKFIGKNNICSSSLDMIMKNRFESAKLYKKLVCMMGETNFDSMSNTEMLKKLCGQDDISFEMKNKNPFTGKNYAKLIIATNSLPITYDKTRGFYRRWFVLFFNNIFTEKIDILATIPEQEYNNLALKCINLLKELLEEREFYNEPSVDEKKEIYEKTSNPLLAFIEEECETDPDYRVPVYKFVDAFMAYLSENGHRMLMKSVIIREMEKQGFEKRVQNGKRIVYEDGVKVEKKTTYLHFMHIKLKEIDEDKELNLDDFQNE